MSRLPVQRTRFQSLLSRFGNGLRRQLRRSWRAGSLSLLALLGGYFLGQNLITLLIFSVHVGRPLLVLLLVLAIEGIVRLRTLLIGEEPSLGWVIADNIRVGAIFAVVFEAFKLGT
jgi:hypothetical protein